MEISMFLATICFNQLRRRNMEIFMFLLTSFVARNMKFPCSLRQDWLKRTWKLLTRSAWKFPLSTFYRKDILKILIFLTDCLIFCKEESFEAFQLQKKTMALVIFAHNSHLGALFTLFISFLVKIWKYLKVSTVMCWQLYLIRVPSFPLLKI